MQRTLDRVNFSEAAVSKIKECLLQEEGKGLRIFLENGKYVLGIDQATQEDLVLNYENFSLYIDPQSLKYVVGLNVDFIQDEEGGIFELTNAFSKDGGCSEGKGACECNKTDKHGGNTI